MIELGYMYVKLAIFSRRFQYGYNVLNAIHISISASNFKDQKTPRNASQVATMRFAQLHFNHCSLGHKQKKSTPTKFSKKTTPQLSTEDSGEK